MRVADGTHHHHQRQQRAAASSEEVNERVREVREQIYNTPDPTLAYNTLQRYGADYLIIGPLERAYSTEEGIAKFVDWYKFYRGIS